MLNIPYMLSKFLIRYYLYSINTPLKQITSSCKLITCHINKKECLSGVLFCAGVYLYLGILSKGYGRKYLNGLPFGLL